MGGQKSEAIRKPGVKNLLPEGDGPIVVFGDSIAFGTGSAGEDLSFCLSNVTSRRVINAAAEGFTTLDSWNQIKNGLNEFPTLVVISVGGNDVIQDTLHANFPKRDTFENLRKIYSKVTDAGALVVHLGIDPPNDMGLPIETDTSRLPEIENIAEKEGVLFLPQSMENLWGNDDYMSDLIHPSSAGYAIICNRLKVFLKGKYEFQ